MEQFVVSARKYRPLTFESVVGQGNIGVTLKNAIKRGHLAHAYLFCGPRGVGKTTCARIFAKTINCLQPTADMEACGECESCRSFAENRSYSIHELDAASNNSVDDIRILTEQVRVPPQIGKYSVYIIDEVHMLSASAFNAFLKTLEEPPAHAIFILATTEKHKIIPTILSRCQIYDFSRITIPDMVRHLSAIAAKENVTVESAALNIIAQKADGAMRDALSIYDQVVAFCGDNITYAGVIENLNVLDYDYYFKLTDHFLQRRFSDALLVFDEVLARGFDAQHFIAGLSAHFRDLLVCKDPRTLQLLEVGDTIAERYKEQAAVAPPAFLFEALQLTNACEMGYKASGNPRLHIELTLVRLANIDAGKKNDSLNDEQAVSNNTPAAVLSSVVPVSAPAAQPVSTVAVEPPVAEVPAAITAAASPAASVTPVTPVIHRSPATSQDPPLPPAPKKSFSLKSAMRQAEQEEKEEEQLREDNAFTQEALETAWEALTEHVSATPRLVRLANALKSAAPTLKEGNTISFFVMNEVQKDWLLKNMADEILGFLGKTLHNHYIQLDVTVAETTDDNKSKLYMPADQFRYLTEKYDNVRELRNAINLDVK